MSSGVGTTSKYDRSDTPTKLGKKWEKSREAREMAHSCDAVDRLKALERFRKNYVERKKQRLLAEVRNVELL